MQNTKVDVAGLSFKKTNGGIDGYPAIFCFIVQDHVFLTKPCVQSPARRRLLLLSVLPHIARKGMCARETFVGFPLHVQSKAANGGSDFCSAKISSTKREPPWVASNINICFSFNNYNQFKICLYRYCCKSSRPYWDSFFIPLSFSVSTFLGTIRYSTSL